MVEGKLAVEGNIVIVVEGGVVNAVYYNGEQQTATIIDYDVDESDNVKVIEGEDAEISSIETEHMSDELAKQLGFEHLTGAKATVLASHKGYDIVQYFANAIIEDEECMLYGDIYISRSQVILNHPGAAIVAGYGVIDPFTGFHLDDAPDWFETIADVVYYIDGLVSEMESLTIVDYLINTHDENEFDVVLECFDDSKNEFLVYLNESLEIFEITSSDYQKDINGYNIVNLNAYIDSIRNEIADKSLSNK